MTLIQLLVGVIVIGVIMSAILQAFVGMWKAQGASVGMSSSQLQAQQMATTLANAFRAAALCASTDSGCIVGANAQNASATSCTIYSRNSSNALVQTTYAVNNGNFQTTVGTGSPTTVYTGASMTLTYYTSSTYYTTAMTTFTPTSSTIANLIAVGIVVSITKNESTGDNSTSTYSTLVSLRNR